MIPFPRPRIFEPWHWDETDFVKQLYQELPFRHPLLRASIRSIARRQDDDIFLFEIEYGSYQFLVAHLWQGLQSGPLLKYFVNWDDLYSNVISPDEKWWQEHRDE